MAKAARERGRFRCFLMTSMENFLRNENERATRKLADERFVAYYTLVDFLPRR